MTLRIPLPDCDLSKDGPWQLPDEVAHYALRVHRKVSGDQCIAFDGRGQERTVTLLVDDESVEVSASGPVRTGVSGYPIHVFYGLPKGDKLDRVARQLTELGASRLVLINTERSVVRWDGARAKKKLLRLNRIITEAARQCGRCDTMSVEGPYSLGEAIHLIHTETVLIFDPSGTSPCPTMSAEEAASIFVGPEGGFSPQELNQIQHGGGLRVHLGPLVLRTETAAPIACALSLSRMGHL